MSENITIKGNEYVLHFNQKLVETIEMSMSGRSLVASIVANNGVLPMATTRQIFSLALLDAKDNSVVKQGKASELFDAAVDESGYLTVDTQVVQALQADVPALFR